MTDQAKKRSHIHLNLGTIVFLVIIIYLTAYVLSYLGKEKLAIYEVSESDISDTIQGTGIIVRDEKLVSTEQDGYVNYYIKDGSRIKANGIVYTIDTTGKIQSYLNELMQNKSTVNDTEKKQIFEELKTFSEGYSDDNFSEVYETKNEINHELMSYTDTIIADNKEKLEEKYGKGCYVEVESDLSGLVSFASDGLEELTEASVTKKRFENKSKMKDLRSTEKLSAGSPVYRIVTGQRWKLILSVNEEDYNRMNNLRSENKNTVQVTFQKDNFVTTVPYLCQKKTDGYYITLTFDNYVQRYLNQRFLSVELLLSETDGLKIPSSSLVTKKVYKIPQKYLTRGSNSSSSSQVNVMTTNKKGVKVLTQVPVTVYRTEDIYVLISTDGLKDGDIISNLDMTETYTLRQTKDIQGVFMVNRGYAVFKPVVILERNEDYCIVSAEESKLELYDRVILNSDTIKENQVIY
ncbi:MAG: HlyD family efflux transporter periplasmic adaptor subunit [Lachnospiraceae bacterium]|nr:HlyD family efflux transporter periplasmic adaptor subunit [Lachnospiraceae bacterium]